VTVQIGLLSDPHATPGPLREALAIFRREGVDAVLCAGDIAGYGPELEQTVELLLAGGCRSVLGNHDLWWLEGSGAVATAAAADYLRALPTVLEWSVADKRLYMVHGSPPASLEEGIRLLDERAAPIPEQVARWRDALRGFAFDLLVVGHTHQVFAERLGDVLVVNPGSTSFNHTCAVVRLPGMEVRFFPLGGRMPVLTWNWGMERRR